MLVEKDVGDFAMLGWLDQYMVGHKGFIAGGCFKNILSGQRAKDIDIFFEKEADFYEAEAYFDRQTPTYNRPDKMDTRYHFLYESKNAKGYIDIGSKVRIELCHKVCLMSFGTRMVSSGWPEKIVLGGGVMERSFLLDMKILFKTVWVVLQRKGAM